jgi:hypothetical protein
MAPNFISPIMFLFHPNQFSSFRYETFLLTEGHVFLSCTSYRERFPQTLSDPAENIKLSGNIHDQGQTKQRKDKGKVVPALN